MSRQIQSDLETILQALRLAGEVIDADQIAAKVHNQYPDLNLVEITKMIRDEVRHQKIGVPIFE